MSGKWHSFLKQWLSTGPQSNRNQPSTERAAPPQVAVYTQVPNPILMTCLLEVTKSSQLTTFPVKRETIYLIKLSKSPSINTRSSSDRTNRFKDGMSRYVPTSISSPIRCRNRGIVAMPAQPAFNVLVSAMQYR